jgi:hypothetical protein
MSSTLFSFSNRAIRHASVALFAVVTLAACDSDRAVSPTSTSAKLPSAGNSSLVPGGRGDLVLGSVNGDMTSIKVLGSSYDVIDPLGDTTKVVDNGQFDSDPVAGTIKLSQWIAGKYTACPLTAPTGYALPQTLCITTTVVSGSGAGIGYLAYLAPSLFWDVRSTALDVIGPGTYTVSTKRNLVKFQVTDNGANDLDPTLGRVAVKISGTGTFPVCESSPPPGYFPALTQCMSATTLGGTKWVGQFMNQEKQVVYIP